MEKNSTEKSNLKIVMKRVQKLMSLLIKRKTFQSHHLTIQGKNTEVELK